MTDYKIAIQEHPEFAAESRFVAYVYVTTEVGVDNRAMIYADTHTRAYNLAEDHIRARRVVDRLKEPSNAASA